MADKLIIIAILVTLCAALAGCQTYQPPGEDLWRAL